MRRNASAAGTGVPTSETTHGIRRFARAAWRTFWAAASRGNSHDVDCAALATLAVVVARRARARLRDQAGDPGHVPPRRGACDPAVLQPRPRVQQGRSVQLARRCRVLAAIVLLLNCVGCERRQLLYDLQEGH